MSRTPSISVRLLVGALACCGVVVAHCAALVLAPQGMGVGDDEHATLAHVLGSAAHGWGIGIAVALGLLVAVFVGRPSNRMWSPWGRPSRARTTSYRDLTIRLALFQVVGFLVMEAAEFWLLNGHLAHFHEAPALIFGIAAQCAGAAIGAALLMVVARAVRLLAGRRPVLQAPSDRARPRPALVVLPTRFSVATGGATLRGPPLPA